MKKIHYYACSVTGSRADNQDNFLIKPGFDKCKSLRTGKRYAVEGTVDIFTRGCFAVFDGMGGEHGGKTASKLAAKTFNNSYLLPVEKRFYAAGKRIESIAKKDRNPGSTAVVADVFSDGTVMSAFVSSIGDSPAFYVKRYTSNTPEICKLTEDDNILSEYIREGVSVSEEEYLDLKSGLTRFLGRNGSYDDPIQYYSIIADVGDAIVLCSDGAFIDEDDYPFFMNEKQPAVALAEYSVRKNFDELNYSDNVTVIVIVPEV